jgi:hypothetical protein
MFSGPPGTRLIARRLETILALTVLTMGDSIGDSGGLEGGHVD